jgi:hypothetical protein
MIKSGDKVEYVDTEYSDKLKKNIKIFKQGIWDGEKVVLNDKQKTTVRKLEWLTKYPIRITSIDIETRIVNNKKMLVYIPKINGLPVLLNGYIFRESINLKGEKFDNYNLAETILKNKIKEIEEFMNNNSRFFY